jgi:ankyrin repeat protein
MGGPDVSELITTPRPKKDIFDAATWNDLDAVKTFVEKEGVPANTTNALKQTAAHIAAAHRDTESILVYLLHKDPSLVAATDKWGHTVLHLAIQKGFADRVKHLVDACNADIYQQIESRFGNTAVHLAAEECRIEIMMYFVEHRKADINVRNALKAPPIFLAAANKHLDMVKYLVSKGANVTLVDKEDDNILYMSARIGDLTVPKYLLDEKKIPFNVDWRDNSGETVLHRAVKHNQLDFVKYWVEKKKPDADMYENLDVYIATELGNLDMVKYLVEHGANYKLNDVNGMIPVEIATDERVKTYLSGLEKARRRRNAPYPPYISLQEGPAVPEFSMKLLQDSGKLPDLFRFRVDDFLAVINFYFEYVSNSEYRGRNEREFLVLSQALIVKDKIDPVAIQAV